MDGEDTIIEICEICEGHFDLDELTYGLCPECRDVLEGHE